MQYQALVEDWGRESLVFFRELPGCFFSLPVSTPVEEVAPAVINAHLEWLGASALTRIHQPRQVQQTEVRIGERLAASAGHGPCFAVDHLPLEEEEVEYALRVAAQLRIELLLAYRRIPPAVRAELPADGSWSMEQHFRHLVEEEAWYISRLQPYPEENPGKKLPQEIPTAFATTAMDAAFTLRNLTDGQRGAVYVHDDEEWTAPKVVRRMAGHLCEHRPVIERMAKQLSQ